jgi:RNA polymerase subunit RPABC4/transcription elongation factor Spt4
LTPNEKCKKCQKNVATDDDQLCDSCRYTAVLTDMWVETKLQQQSK